MMHQPAIGDLGRAFRMSTGAAAYQRFVQRQQEEERQRRERREDARNDDAELMDFAMVVVSASEIAQFRSELDRYDAATIAALQENEVELAQIRERMEELLGQAYVLPDGRRVFKTEDGLRVFDEHGIELDASTIDPDLIGDDHPHWETYRSYFDRAQELISERDEILRYQQELDEARERLDAGDMTQDEFDQMREQLVAEMPDAVRSQIPELASQALETGHDTPSAHNEATFVVDDDMVPTASKSFAPGFSG